MLFVVVCWCFDVCCLLSCVVCSSLRCVVDRWCFLYCRGVMFRSFCDVCVALLLVVVDV